MKPVVVIVDDEADILDIAAQLLEQQGMQAVTFTEPLKVLQYLSENGKADALVSDVYMPVMGGLELIEKIKTVRPRLATVLLTGFADKQIAIKALNEGCQYLVEKPLVNREFIYCVEMAVTNGRWEVIGETLLKECQELINLLAKQSEVYESRFKQAEVFADRGNAMNHLQTADLKNYLSSIAKGLDIESKVHSATKVVQEMSSELAHLRSKIRN
jgi:FixJ family two-component response regulator